MTQAINCGFARRIIVAKYCLDKKKWFLDYNTFFNDYPALYLDYNQVRKRGPIIREIFHSNTCDWVGTGYIMIKRLSRIHLE